jgi:hypothetical protein
MNLRGNGLVFLATLLATGLPATPHAMAQGWGRSAPNRSTSPNAASVTSGGMSWGRNPRRTYSYPSPNWNTGARNGHLAPNMPYPSYWSGHPSYIYYRWNRGFNPYYGQTYANPRFHLYSTNPMYQPAWGRTYSNRP